MLLRENERRYLEESNKHKRTGAAVESGDEANRGADGVDLGRIHSQRASCMHKDDRLAASLQRGLPETVRSEMVQVEEGRHGKREQDEMQVLWARLAED